MSQSKAREARQTIPADDRKHLARIHTQVKAARAVRTQERQQALELEKADTKRERNEERARQRQGFVGRFGGRFGGAIA